MDSPPNETYSPVAGGAERSEDISVALLKRVLDEIESSKRRQGLDILLAIVISLAALGSAWCAYQSSRWNGTQLGLIGEADFRVVEATREMIWSLQWRTVDALMLMHFVEASESGETKSAEAIRVRFRPEARAAMEEWLKSDPLNNPQASLQPFMSNEAYRAAVGAKGEELQKAAENAQQQAREAGNNGDRYTLLALLYATVMFLGGITGTFDARGVRRLLAVVALLLFVATGVALALSPVCGG